MDNDALALKSASRGTPDSDHHFDGGTDDLADDLAELLRGAADWTVYTAGVWAYARPGRVVDRVQGWKLHVSATVMSAPDVLRACIDHLVRARCPFKIARSTREVSVLTGPHFDRAQSGKIMTIYPHNDASLRRIAEALDSATRGFAGPKVLSDRPFSKGSVISYRYGAFTGVPRLSLDGAPIAALLAPDGSVIPDVRQPRFSPPVWAVDPLSPPLDPPATDVPTAPAPAGGVGSTPAAVFIHDRYEVHTAIRHANRGGVFRATDTSSGHRVIVKQGRRHIGVGRSGTDVRDLLRREAVVLQELADVDAVPTLIDTFDEDGDVFLVEEDCGEINLRRWVESGVVGSVVRRSPADLELVLAGLARAVAKVHNRGVTIGDLSPNNVIIGPQLTVRLIDFELAVLPGEADDGAEAGTPGYVAPERAMGIGGQPADRYALGKILVFALTGEHAVWDGTSSDLAAWLRVGARGLQVPAPIRALAVELCDPDPAARPTAAAARDRLTANTFVIPEPDVVVAHQLSEQPTLLNEELDTAIAELTNRLLLDIDPNADEPIKASSVGKASAITNVHHGIAGVLGVLAQLAARFPTDARITSATASMTERLRVELDELAPGGPVGIYFGGAGPCWALAEAAAALSKPELLAESVDRVLSIDRTSPLLDVTHGLAGLGMTLHELWQRTADDRLLVAATEVGDRLVSAARQDEHGVFWQVPRNVSSLFAGGRYAGYAHGAAGIATFLLVLGRTAAQFREIGESVVDRLIRDVHIDDGCARWAAGLDDDTSVNSHWCNGTAGVLSALLASERDNCSDLLRASGHALLADRWRFGIAQCHGLAGSVDALLDLDRARPGHHWRERAGETAHLAWSRREHDDVGLKIGDLGVGVVTDFSAGYPGLLSALLHLRYGGRRLWHPELTS